MSFPFRDTSLVMRAAAGGFPVLCPQLPAVCSPTGLVESEVTQTPKYLIKSRKEQVTLRCSPKSGHCSVYWYQQALGQGPQSLVQYYSQQGSGEAQLLDRFSGKQFSDFHSELNLTSLELTASAMYLHGSSQDTALHDQVPLGQNTPAPAQEVVPRVSAASLPSPVSGRAIDFPRRSLLGTS